MEEKHFDLKKEIEGQLKLEKGLQQLEQPQLVEKAAADVTDLKMSSIEPDPAVQSLLN